MSRIALAFRVFFAVLFNAVAADRMRAALDSHAAPSADATSTSGPDTRSSAAKPAPPARPAAPARSEAITLLATLQREARLIDFLQERLDDYSDAQIGAAVRDVHRQAGDTLRRLFDLAPVADGEEGAMIDVPAEGGAARFHLVGAVGGSGARRGALRHKGWRATRCQLPEWTGEESAKFIVAPAEVELS